MPRLMTYFQALVLCAVVWPPLMLEAAKPFGLPECAANFDTEVVLNAPMLDAMIRQAEPGGTRPARQHERLFIVVKHYLERSQGLLLIARDDDSQRPLLLTHDCQSYLDAPAHIRTYFADLTGGQKEALRAYQQRVRPVAQRAAARIGDMASVPQGEATQHDGQTVTLEAFSIDIYEVTNAQYRQFIEAGGYTTRELWSEDGWTWVESKSRRQPSYWEHTQLNTPEQPVVGVTWYEADAYCRWVGKTLPTEIQWDKACRGDGESTPMSQPVEGGGSNSNQQPAAVGSSPQTQSPYGVHDMTGNVLEWTRTDRGGQQIVLCGGSGQHTAPPAGCGVRHTLFPGISANFIGFRCQSETP